jgi:tocopherol O-methyltransferase
MKINGFKTASHSRCCFEVNYVNLTQIVRGGVDYVRITDLSHTFMNEKERTKAYKKIVTEYYDFCTRGYREVWGSDYFHQHFWNNNETREEGIARTHQKILSSMNIVPSAYVADFGCGIGTFSLNILSQNFAQVAAVNISKKHLAIAKKEAKRKNISNVTFLEKDLMEISYDNEFDAVFLYDVEPHLPNREKMLKKIFKALKPGGKMMMTAWLKTDNCSFVAEQLLVEPFCEAFAYPYLETDLNYKKLIKKIGFTTVANEDWTDETARSVRNGYDNTLQFVAQSSRTDVLRMLELSNLSQITRLNEIGMQMARTVLYWRAILDSGVFKYRFYVLEKPKD